jgi:Ni/Co efflux regulator RcnB
MALSNAERQKRWIEKNRALHNLRRRKKNLSGGVYGHAEIGGGTETSLPSESLAIGSAAPRRLPPNNLGSGNQAPTAQKSKIQELRELVRKTEEANHVREITEEVVKPQVFRNDYGAIISENAWKRLQKLKEKAREGGYILDEYSQ